MDSQEKATRSRNPPKVYTTSVTRSHGNKPMTYKLNVKKALDKKIEATDGVRSCNIEFKGGTSTLVIICNVGAYEILKILY